MGIFPASLCCSCLKEHQQLSINKSRKKMGFCKEWLLRPTKPVFPFEPTETSQHTHTNTLSFSHRGNVIPLISSFSVVGFDIGNVDNPCRSAMRTRGEEITFDLILFSSRRTRSNEKVLGELITTYFHIHLWV